jgi:hypothetical protein
VGAQNSHDSNEPISLDVNRCNIDMLLDFFCHIEPHIIDKEIEVEHRLLFEMRKKQTKDLENTTNPNSISNSISLYTSATITQPFLLSLFIHQANWHKLNNCVLFLFNSHDNNKLISK